MLARSNNKPTVRSIARAEKSIKLAAIVASLCKCSCLLLCSLTIRRAYVNGSSEAIDPITSVTMKHISHSHYGDHM